MSADRVQRFLREFTRWARSRPDVLAAALVGSHARASARPDSDIDLVLLSEQPEQYLADFSWTACFGKVLRQQIEDYTRLGSVRVWYDDGREVELGITDRDWAASPLDEGTRRVIADGMVVLFEHGDILSRHQALGKAGAAHSPAF